MGKLVTIKINGKPYPARRSHWHMNPESQIDFEIIMTGKQITHHFKKSMGNLNDPYSWIIKADKGNGEIEFEFSPYPNLSPGHLYEVYLNMGNGLSYVCRLD